jgi:pyruvate dehydrogenase E2 component (dihydrolipoamide acetyltransferase)
MAIEVMMPVITQEGDDGVVTAWMVDEGSRVVDGRLIAEVQAEKVAAEVYAPEDGVVRDLVPVNEPVPQGRPICLIVGENEAEVPASTGGGSAAGVPVAPARPAVSPAARRRARELDVDIGGVSGSGPGGRVTEADVEAAAGGGPPSVELAGLRAVIARNMRESARSAAAVTLTTTVDLTEVQATSITARVIRAVALALTDHARLNGTREGDRFIPGGEPAIGLAIQTDEGLVAPVIRRAASRTVGELAAEVSTLAERARNRLLTAADFEGGTFSISNLGSYGIDAFTPIINPPQIAILGVGALRAVPGFDSGGVLRVRKVLTLSLTFDHAFVDGAPAAAFLADLRQALESS